MKKSLILLPIAAMILSGCSLLPAKKSKSSSSATNTQQSGSTKSSGSVTPVNPSSDTPVDWPTAHESTFDTTPGEHTVTYDFNSEYTALKEAFPYVTADMSAFHVYMKGMSTMVYHCWCNANSSPAYNYLFMRNNNGFYDNKKVTAFIGNHVTLGAITKVEITCPDNSSASAKYDITLSKTVSEEPSTSGTELTKEGGSVTASVSDGYGFFKITQKDTTHNGQLSTLKITYTIS